MRLLIEGGSYLISHSLSHQVGAGLHGTRPIAYPLVLVKDQACGTRLVMFDFALAHEVLLAVVLVAMEADRVTLFAAQFLWLLY